MKWTACIILLLWILHGVAGLRFQNRGAATQDTEKRRLSYQRPGYYDSGGHLGRQTSSLTGFAMNLGTGLTIGYGPDASGLRKPRPVAFPHEHQGDFELNHPATCLGANSRNFLRTRDQRKAFDIDESIVECEVKNNMNQSSCFGKISITEVNLTSSDPNVLGYEVRVLKGCGDRDLMEMELRALSYRYDTLRRCWTSPILREENTHANALLSEPDFLGFLGHGSLSALGKTRLRAQSEICFCEGDYCNTGVRGRGTRVWMPLILVATFLLRGNTHLLGN